LQAFKKYETMAAKNEEREKQKSDMKCSGME
jgi:hypothetical protein